MRPHAKNLEWHRNAKYNVLFSFLNFELRTLLTEAVAQRCSVKNMFLKILQNSQENTCARDTF